MPGTRLKWEGMLKYCEDEPFFLTGSTWFSILRTNINGSTCVSYSCSKEPAVEGTQTLFLPALTRERGYYFLRILAALLEFLSVEAHAAGVQMEILLRRSSLRPWLGHATYGSFAHHAQPTQAATNIQPTSQLLVHGRGAPLRLPAHCLFVPVWGRRFLPLCVCSSGVVLILPEAGCQWQFEYFVTTWVLWTLYIPLFCLPLSAKASYFFTIQKVFLTTGEITLLLLVTYS